jgi:hypothetical protein
MCRVLPRRRADGICSQHGVGSIFKDCTALATSAEKIASRSKGNLAVAEGTGPASRKGLPYG